jgi:hypothetical protein
MVFYHDNNTDYPEELDWSYEEEGETGVGSGFGEAIENPALFVKYIENLSDNDLNNVTSTLADYEKVVLKKMKKNKTGKSLILGNTAQTTNWLYYIAKLFSLYASCMSSTAKEIEGIPLPRNKQISEQHAKLHKDTKQEIQRLGAAYNAAETPDDNNHAIRAISDFFANMSEGHKDTVENWLREYEARGNSRTGNSRPVCFRGHTPAQQPQPETVCLTLEIKIPTQTQHLGVVAEIFIGIMKAAQSGELYRVNGEQIESAGSFPLVQYRAFTSADCSSGEHTIIIHEENYQTA